MGKNTDEYADEVFCTLHIQSNTQSELPPRLFRGLSGIDLRFVDLRSPEWRKRRERVAARSSYRAIPPFRYHWSLCSDGFVEDKDILSHLRWIFERVYPEAPLRDVLGPDFLVSLSVYWGGQGVGHGPVISQQVAELLVRQRVEMEVSFYAVE